MFWRKSTPESREARVIDQARKSLRHFERWGRWYNAFGVAAAIVGFVLMIAVGNLIAAVAKNAPANRFEVFFGFVIGVLVGGGFYKASSGFADVFRAALPDERDRLLVQYHDALRQVLDGRTGAEANNADSWREKPTNGAPVPRARHDHFA